MYCNGVPGSAWSLDHGTDRQPEGSSETGDRFVASGLANDLKSQDIIEKILLNLFVPGAKNSILQQK